MRAGGVLPLLGMIGLASCGLREFKNEMSGDFTEGLHPEVIGTTTMMPAWEDVVQHTRLSSPVTLTHPAAARDGKHFVYASTETGPRYQIFLRGVDTAAPMQLTNQDADHLFPRISPDGRRVAFASNRSGNWDLYVLRVDAPATWMQLTSDPHDEIAPSWSPDGKRIAYCARVGDGYWRIVLIDVGTGIPTYLGAGMYPDWSPHPDPKDQWISFQSQPHGGGKSGIWVVRPDGTGLREIAADRHKEWAAAHPRWSPDGRWIAYATVRRSRESRAFGEENQADDLWIITPRGEFDTRLTDDLSPEWWPSWGGDRLFFVSIRNGNRNVFSVRPKSIVK